MPAENYFGNLSAPIQPLSVFDQAFSAIPVSSFLAGVDTTGTLDSLGTLNALVASSPNVFLSPAPNGYKLSANWVPATKDCIIDVSADAFFTGALPDYKNMIPYEATPIYAQSLNRKTYDSHWNGIFNVFHVSAMAKATNTTAQVVALYSQGEAAGPGSIAFGANPVGTSSNATSTAIAIEIDPTVTVTGGTAYGCVIASTSFPGVTANFPSAVDIGSNGFTSRFTDGIYYNFSDVVVDGGARGCLSNAAINLVGGGGAGSTCNYFFRASGVSALVAEISLPSFTVDPTPAGTVQRIRVKAGGTGVAPLLLSTGSLGLNIAPGSGGGNLQLLSADLTTKVSLSNTGLGFNGTAPVAKPTVTGSKGGNAALASLLTALASMGLITDSST